MGQNPVCEVSPGMSLSGALCFWRDTVFLIAVPYLYNLTPLNHGIY